MPKQKPELTRADCQYRSFQVPMEVRASDDQEYIVEGYAAKWMEYNLWSKYFERIDSKAFDAADMTDVVFRYDHEGHVYARTSNGTLKLEIDKSEEGGLRVWADLSKTQAARDMYEEISAGLVTKMSWAFTVKNANDEYHRDDEGKVTKIVRAITDVDKVYDVAPVSIPANDKTDVSARSWVDGVIAQESRREQQRKRLALQIQIEKGK